MVSLVNQLLFWKDASSAPTYFADSVLFRGYCVIVVRATVDRRGLPRLGWENWGSVPSNAGCDIDASYLSFLQPPSWTLPLRCVPIFLIQSD